jgi:hypothetical protein
MPLLTSLKSVPLLRSRLVIIPEAEHPHLQKTALET